jgi:hypothetical protein
LFSCYRDAVATVLLAEWPLTTNLFDSDSLEGLVPRLFTANLEEVRKNFTTNLDLAFKDLNKLTSRFFTTENLHPLNALEYLDKPKYTEFIKKKKQLFKTVPKLNVPTFRTGTVVTCTTTRGLEPSSQAQVPARPRGNKISKKHSK